MKSQTSRSDILTPEYLGECFSPNYETGDLVWKQRPEHHFKDSRAYKVWNSSRAGEKAGRLMEKGNSDYWRTTLCNQYFYNHHLIWVMFYGWLPDMSSFEIDHVNRESSDNSIRNLRLADRVQNSRNTCGRSSQHPKGVCFDKARGKFLFQFRRGSFYIRARVDDRDTATHLYRLLSLASDGVYSYFDISDLDVNKIDTTCLTDNFMSKIYPICKVDDTFMGIYSELMGRRG